ncbi:MAG: hypothetical protein ACLVEX_12390 [Ruthenibacterium lactatiformans]
MAFLAVSGHGRRDDRRLRGQRAPAVRAYKKQAEKIKEEQARELEKLHAKRRALYLDEDIDIEAEAAKAEAARLAAQAEEAAGADAPDGSADDGESGEAAEEDDGGDD